MNKNLVIYILIFSSWAMPIHSYNNINQLDNEIDFISLGDWGGASLGGYHLTNTQNTALSIYNHMNKYNSKFILNSGDNFYYCGIENISDPQISKDYTSIFGQINLTWYNTLGNHDYGFEPNAQLQLNTIISNWVLDDRYYHRKLNINNISINIIVLDTNPCINDYRENDRSKWDPCNYEFPTCGPEPGVCKFHDNILTQNCSTQLQWFENILNNISDNEWTIVVGHHPASEINTCDFQSLLSTKKVHLYINGHVHSLQQYSVDGQEKYITTGAASMVMPRSLSINHDILIRNNVKLLFNKLDTGYTSHTIIDNTLTTNFWSITGNIIHSFQVKK
jgi:tartrate-resistant acid phosphatase type 5